MGFWSAAKRQFKAIQADYMGGHPLLPMLGKVGLEADGDHINICGGIKWEPVISIPKADIVGVTLDRSDERSIGKAATGAIIGGVLTGGVGAVAGAAIGGRKKDTSVIVMTIRYGAGTVDMIFGSENTKLTYNSIAGLLR